jgi:single-stranded-DNA-specific exonuclease
MHTAREQILKLDASSKLFFVHGKDWPEGIVGLVAGKLAEEFNRPVLIGSEDAAGIITGSARSTPEFHIADALHELSQYLLRYGGHAQAAGFTLKADTVKEFKEELLKAAERKLLDSDTTKKLEITLESSIPELTIAQVGELEQLQPFGYANPRPMVAIKNLAVSDIRRVGSNNQHIKLTLTDPTPNSPNPLASKHSKLEAIGFNLNPDWNVSVDDLVDVVGSVEINIWNGSSSVQMSLKDIRKSIQQASLS